MSATPAVRLANRRQTQRLETRARLFQAAIEEFRRVGFDAAQIDDIVEAVGVARGTFYFHFPTKDHVLIELQRRGQESVVERLASVRSEPGAGSVKGFLQQVLDVILAEASRAGETGLMRDVLSVMLRTGVGTDLADHPLVEALMEFFAEAQRRGEIRQDLTPHELTMILLSSLPATLLSNRDRPEVELRPALRRVIDVFVRGVAP